MAILFEIGAEFGAERSNITAFGKFFAGLNLTLSDGTDIEITFDDGTRDVWRDPDGNWWCRIVPEEVSLGVGPRKVEKLELMVELVKKLYGALGESSGFRFARIGWEVEESISIDDLLNAKAKARPLPAGLVLSRELWQRMGSPTEFSPLGEYSMWKSPLEQDYFEMVRW